MKLFIKLLIVFFTFFFTSQVFANDTVNYISMNKILNESMAGLSIKNKLEKIHKSNIEKFKTKDQDFKTKEQSLLSKRNLMKKDEFELKINDLRENYKKYQEEKKKKLQEISNKRNKGTEQILKTLQKILANYSNENNISIILDKRNIIIGKTDLDITEKVMLVLNKELPVVKIN